MFFLRSIVVRKEVFFVNSLYVLVFWISALIFMIIFFVSSLWRKLTEVLILLGFKKLKKSHSHLIFYRVSSWNCKHLLTSTLHDSDCLRSIDYVLDKIPLIHVSQNDLTSFSNPNGYMSRLIGVNDFFYWSLKWRPIETPSAMFSIRVCFVGVLGFEPKKTNS